MRRQNDLKEKEVQRIGDLLKRVCECSEIYDYLELVEKESKYRYIQASIGTTGYEVTSRQKQEIEQNISQTEKKLGQLEKEIVRKMGELMQQSSPHNDEIIREYSRVKSMIEKKLQNMGSEELKFNSLGDALSVFMAGSSKK